MKQCISRPLTLAAEQFTGTDDSAESLHQQGHGNVWHDTDWRGRWTGRLVVNTRVGLAYVEPNDWILRDRQGRFSVMKPDTFDEHYLAADGR